MFKKIFGCKNVLVATHQNSQIIQRLFRLQNCLSRKPSIFWKYSKTFSTEKISQQQPILILKKFKVFFACKIVLAANHRYPGNIQRLYRLQNCRSRKSSIPWKYSKTFSAANLSQPQIIGILDIFKDFSACKIVLAATHQYSENVQKLFRLQNCRSRKSAISWKHSKIFPPAKMSQPQTIYILEIFKDFFGCKNVSVATHHYSENIQRLFRLQKCLSPKLSISWKYSKIFLAAKMSQQQPINILKTFKDFFACKIVLAANHRFPGNFQRLFRLQKCLSSNPSVF